MNKLSKDFTIQSAKLNNKNIKVKCYEDYIVYKNEKYLLEGSGIDEEDRDEKDKIYIEHEVYKKN